MDNSVALFNPKTKTLHHPHGNCGHVNFSAPHISIKSWASAEGRHARTVGKVCRTCRQIGRFNPPPLIAQEEDK